MNSFGNKKGLRFVITLGTATFDEAGNNQITLEGFRASVDIDKAGGVQMSTLRAKIYGVSQSDMASITTLQWRPSTMIPNTVEVFAIDGDAETLVFAGNIVNAWGDYQSPPDVYLHIQAQAAYYAQVKAIPPRSFRGGVDVASVMRQIAQDSGLAFENNGVQVQLADVYLAGSGTEQIKELAKAAGIDLYIDDKTLAITPPNMPRGGLVPLISAQSGLVGYPTVDGWGVNVQCLFHPSVTFGGRFKLETDVSRASGEWLAACVAYHLESEKPGGAWFMTIRGNQLGLAIVR